MLWLYMGCFGDVGVGWDGRRLVGCVGHRFLWLSLGFLWVLGESLSTFSSLRWWMSLQKVAFHRRFELRLIMAKAHSPDVLSSIFSYGLGLEHGWLAQRSLPAYKRNVLCLAAALRAFTISVPALVELMAKRHAPASSLTPQRCPAPIPYILRLQR